MDIARTNTLSYPVVNFEVLIDSTDVFTGIEQLGILLRRYYDALELFLDILKYATDVVDLKIFVGFDTYHPAEPFVYV